MIINKKTKIFTTIIAFFLVLIFCLGFYQNAVVSAQTQPAAPTAETPAASGGSQPTSYGLSLFKDNSSLIKDTPTQIIGRIIQYVLGLVGVILVVMLIWGGFTYMTSAGNEQKTTQAKKVLTYAIVGVVIIALAFAATRFILQALYSRTASTGGTPAQSGTGGTLPASDPLSQPATE